MAQQRIDPGTFRLTADIEKPVETGRNRENEPKITWTKQVERRVKVENTGGREVQDASQTQAVASHKVTTWLYRSMLPDWRFKVYYPENVIRYFNVVWIQEPDPALACGGFMICYCEENVHARE